MVIIIMKMEGTLPPEKFEWIGSNSSDCFKHPVYSNVRDLKQLLNYITDPEEGIDLLVAEYIFDSEEAILEIINQNLKYVDPAIAELIFAILYFYRDCDHKAVLIFH